MGLWKALKKKNAKTLRYNFINKILYEYYININLYSADSYLVPICKR